MPLGRALPAEFWIATFWQHNGAEEKLVHAEVCMSQLAHEGPPAALWAPAQYEGSNEEMCLVLLTA